MAMRIKQKVTLPSLKKIIISIFILQRNHSADDEIQKYGVGEPILPCSFTCYIEHNILLSLDILISGFTSI